MISCKNLLSVVLLAIAVAPATEAQSIYCPVQSNVDMLNHVRRKQATRREFILPDVNGFHVYKADLHMHTIYSDGSTTPEYRMQEAWYDGLDVIAITDHVEYRRWEGKMLSFLKGYLPEETKAVNDRLITQPANEKGIQTDLNVPYKAAAALENKYGITVIPGAEITREPVAIGHYNALFIKDANSLYDADPAVSMKNARKQGALIMHNHPGWSRKTVKMTEFENKVYGMNLIDGIEVMNGGEFYPTIVQRAKDYKLFMSANTDMHGTTLMDYVGDQRNMTLILAKDKSLASLKEALKERRTLAYSFGTVAGDEQLVKDFFLACVKFEVFYTNDKGRRSIRMTNMSSVDYVINFGSYSLQLRPFTSRDVTADKGKSVTFTVENMWIPGDAKHPVISVNP